jgi:hypothetical protein
MKCGENKYYIFELKEVLLHFVGFFQKNIKTWAKNFATREVKYLIFLLESFFGFSFLDIFFVHF